jgi:hypothetical protein
MVRIISLAPDTNTNNMAIAASIGVLALTTSWATFGALAILRGENLLDPYALVWVLTWIIITVTTVAILRNAALLNKAYALAKKARITVDAINKKLLLELPEPIDAFAGLCTIHYVKNAFKETWEIACSGKKKKNKRFELPLQLSIPRHVSIFNPIQKAEIPGILLGNVAILVIPAVYRVKLIPKKSKLTIKSDKGVASTEIKDGKVSISITPEGAVEARLMIISEEWEELIAKTYSSLEINMNQWLPGENIMVITTNVTATPENLLEKIFGMRPPLPLVLGKGVRVVLESDGRSDETMAKVAVEY